jgi:CheY-like chemotaxis protein
VVEDHDGLREYSTSVLRELGYRVLEASEGGQALEILRRGTMCNCCLLMLSYRG